MKQSELARLLQVPLDKIRRMTKEELEKVGWRKVGSGKGCHYRNTGKDAVTEPRDDVDFDIKRIEARRRLADAVGKELKNEDTKRTLIIKASEIFQDAFLQSFDNYAKEIYKLELTENSRNHLQGMFIKCQKLFSEELAIKLQELFKPF